MKQVLLLLISVLSMNAFAGGTKMIYAVTEEYGGLVVYINSLQVWLEEGHLTDSYTEEESKLVEAFIDKTSLCNLMESTYEPCKESSKKEDLMKRLAEADPKNFSYNEDFQQFIEDENKE